MGLFDFLRRLFLGSPRSPEEEPAPFAVPTARDERETSPPASPGPASAPSTPSPGRLWRSTAPPRQGSLRLEPLRYESSLIPTPHDREIVDKRPYRFAISGSRPGEFLDLSQDLDQRWLDYYGLPALATPDQLAHWLQIPVGRLAWLTHRTRPGLRAATSRESHYVTRWVRKRRGGWRLIESPKAELQRVQELILKEILQQVPAHSAAHGFIRGRSIVTNATPHVGQRFLLQFDLQNFYATVRYNRVVAIFRSLGYSREVALWLARLTTTSLPWDAEPPDSQTELGPYRSLHLPQGAPTSPALANLSAFGLDVRLCGLAKCYGLKYTRYADDLTFSGPGRAVPALRDIIPLVEKIVRSERFVINRFKRRVIRNSQRQRVTGVVVNDGVNISRREFDTLKAILHNCVRQGPASQNRHNHADFAAHLRGRVAHVSQLNPARGAKLLTLYQQIDWRR